MTTNRVFLAALAILLAPPLALAQADSPGELQVGALEIPASGQTTGNLVALFIDHDRATMPLAQPAFHLTTPHATIVAHHAAVRMAGFDAGFHQETIHEGAATIEGLDTRRLLHLWITPLDDQNPPLTRMDHAACTSIQPPEKSSERRSPSVNQNQPDVLVDTHASVHASSCDEATLTIEGDVTLTVWEWDLDLNGRRIPTGTNETAPDTGAGSATELVITAYNVNLTIPLTPETYAVHLTNSTLATHSLYVVEAQGALPGIPTPLTGQDVELVGDYFAAIASQGIQQPLAVALDGATQAAAIDGTPFISLAPALLPSDDLPTLRAWILLGLVFVSAFLIRFSWPLAGKQIYKNIYARCQIYIPTELDLKSPQSHRTGARTRKGNRKANLDTTKPRRGYTTAGPTKTRTGDANARQQVKAVVASSPGLVIRELLARARMSKERAYHALDALLAEGSVVEFEDGSRRHIFIPAPGLEEHWKKLVLMREEKHQKLLAWLSVHPGVCWREIRNAAEVWGWCESTTKMRLRRLVDIHLVTREGPPRRGTFSVLPTPTL